MVSISQAWCNNSYTVAAKPIKSLELYYTLNQLFNKLHVAATWWTFNGERSTH